MRTLRYVICDVFTEQPLAGNQLAVFTNAAGLDVSTMQALAREMNFSETVFVLPKTGAAHARLRIFTPRKELPFAGHPILGTAFVIGTTVQLDVLQLETEAGTIAVSLEREGGRVAFARMAQPIPALRPFDRERELLDALGVERSELPIALYDNGAQHVYVALRSPDAVAQVLPDLRRLAQLGGCGVNVFAGSGTRYKTRMFHPSAGVDEDPATGSAAGSLALHLALHGRVAFGEEIQIEQGAELGRPSLLYARADGSPESVRRVEVGGCAVIVARGEFRLTV